MRELDVIYCAAGNKAAHEVAREEGWRLGAQLSARAGAVPSPCFFADQNWKNPDRAFYMRKLAQYRPDWATVLDLEQPSQLAEVLDWAAEAEQHVKRGVIVIPKCDVIDLIPERYRLGFSVPTSHGKTTLPFVKFLGRDVHLLGGAPHVQMEILWRSPDAQVRSVDLNMQQKMAFERCLVWTQGDLMKNGAFRVLESSERVENDAHLHAFRLSCRNIIAAWRSFGFSVNSPLTS